MNINSGKDPLLDVFDCPDPSIKTPRRGVTITPLQALALMNSTFVQRQAQYLAERALADSGNNSRLAIQRAYRLVLGRLPSDVDQARAAEGVNQRGMASLCWALLNSTEFIYTR